ncbi:sensor histidine kinase (plasmid) [Devosia neptuniae]|uniref:histidine kinase n=1 Tax=Devosia neptuniae TaxID=191302 RepID=A0ABY6C6E7_9HYPH|nr:HWE histidine kinase domain-containing protein [Devosia neptuniae]UXN67875.1 sensor histidine kinase [Devosia neptuniae]
MAEIVRTFDWSSTPLGPITNWPSPLRTVVNLMLESDFPKAIAWGPDLITIHNDAFLPILGEKPSAVGRPFSQVWSEAWDIIGPIAQDAFAGESTFIEDFPLIIERSSAPEQAYFTFCYSPIRGDDGQVMGMMDTVIETTQGVVARQTEAVLHKELAHRIKNVMAVTGAVVNSTLRHARTLDEARESIGNRLAALGKAQDMVTDIGQGSELSQLIRTGLAPYRLDWDRIGLSGPLVNLPSTQVIPFSLIIYELATNAAKYGALSSADGHLNISWSISEQRQFSFRWKEGGLSGLREASRTGFGSQLLTRIAPAYFRGQASIDLRITGMEYLLTGQILTD